MTDAGSNLTGLKVRTDAFDILQKIRRHAVAAGQSTPRYRLGPRASPCQKVLLGLLDFWTRNWTTISDSSLYRYVYNVRYQLKRDRGIVPFILDRVLYSKQRY